MALLHDQLWAGCLLVDHDGLQPVAFDHVGRAVVGNDRVDTSDVGVSEVAFIEADCPIPDAAVVVAKLVKVDMTRANRLATAILKD